MTRVLLTNDDGIDAPGLLALEKAFSQLPQVELWTCAPDGQRSACSHAMSLTRPITANQVGNRRYAISGYVADCVYLALFQLMPSLPDVVVSGINKGPNLGSDVIYSGTVAGAREGVVRGIHGISLSLVKGDDFSLAAANSVQLALVVANQKQTKSPTLLNVNYPAGSFTGPKYAPLGQRLYPKIVETRTVPISGDNYYWLGGPPVKDALIPASDADLIQRGIASITPLVVDQTDFDALKNTEELPLGNLEE